MAQFTIKPASKTSLEVTYSNANSIRIDSIDNVHALYINFAQGDVISANTELKVTQGYPGPVKPEVVVNYTEL
jgi:hypothetical protein